MNNRLKYKIVFLTVFSSILIHLAFGAGLYLGSYYYGLLLGVALAIPGLLMLIIARHLKFNTFRFLSCWWIAGSISNLIDEVTGMNERYEWSETYIFIILLLTLLNIERRFIAQNK